MARIGGKRVGKISRRMVAHSDSGGDQSKQVEGGRIGRSGVKDVATNHFRRSQISAVETIPRGCALLIHDGRIHARV